VKKWLIVFIALIVVSPALAQERPSDDPPTGPPPAIHAAHNQVVRFLELSEDQVMAWDEMVITHHEAEQLIREDIVVVEQALRELLDGDDPDAEAVGELFLERHALGQDLAEVHRTYHDGFVALLDEEQQGRLQFINRADDVQPIIPAFKAFELIPRR